MSDKAAKARAVCKTNRAQRSRAFVEAWNKADRVSDVAEQFGVKVGSARSRACRLRRAGYDVKMMPNGKGRHPRLRVGQRVRLGLFVGTVSKRIAATNQVVIVWPDGRAEMGTCRGRMACGEFVEVLNG